MSQPTYLALPLGDLFKLAQAAWNDANAVCQREARQPKHLQPTHHDFIESLLVFLTQRLRALPGYQCRGGVR